MIAPVGQPCLVSKIASTNFTRWQFCSVFGLIGNCLFSVCVPSATRTKMQEQIPALRDSHAKGERP